MKWYVKKKNTSDGLNSWKYLSQPEFPFKIETLGMNKWLNEKPFFDAAEQLLTWVTLWEHLSEKYQIL